MSAYLKYGAVLIALLSISLSVQAQIPAATSGIDLTVSTENPVPGQIVTITARSYSSDINSASITWTVDSKTVQSGTGLTTYSLKAPDIGKKLNVTVRAVFANGRTSQESVSIGSGAIDLIIESEGYIPPFFLGKIDPTYQSRIKVVAIPHLASSAGAEYDPKTLVYTWKKNDKVIESASGYGKQSITLDGDLVPREFFVSVDVRTRDNSAKSSSLIGISPTSPKVGFYINDPLYGAFFNKIVSDYIRIGGEKEVRVLGIPFGFAKPSEGRGDLSYSWSINGSTRTELSDNQSVILRSPTEASGSANVALDVRHNTNILQGARGGFGIEFTTPTQSNSITF